MTNKVQMSTKDSFQGLQLGKWCLLERIGRGGMSEVYKASHTDTNQVSAIKILTLEGNIGDDLIERFYHEVHILRRLKHPNILDVYEFGFEQEVGFYIVMEFLVGCTLHEYMLGHQGDYPLENVFIIIKQVCDAMAFAHEKDIIHRDLKPENIFLCGGPESLDDVKVLDFGIAKFQLGESSRLTEGGTTLGTPHYISPEQARGEVVGPAADIYSLTVILFEMLTGNPLFQANSPLEYLMRHAYNVPPTITQSRIDLVFPRPLTDLVSKGLEKQPEDRPTSMGQLKQWLYEAIAGQELSHATIPMKSIGKDTLEVGAYHIESTVTREQTARAEFKPLKLGGGSKQKAESSDDSNENIGLSRIKQEAVVPQKQPEPKRMRSLGLVRSKETPATSTSWQLPVIIGGIILLVAVFSSALTYRLLKDKSPRVTPTSDRRSTPAVRPLARSASAAHSADAGTSDLATHPDGGAMPEGARSDGPTQETPDAAPKVRTLGKKGWRELINQKLLDSSQRDESPASVDGGVAPLPKQRPDARRPTIPARARPLPRRRLAP